MAPTDTDRSRRGADAGTRSSVPAAPRQERDVLGSCLSNGTSWWRAVEAVAGDDLEGLFYDRDLRMVARAAEAVVERDGALTVWSLSDHLARDPASDVLVPSVEGYLVTLQAHGWLRDLTELRATLGTLVEKRALRAQLRGLDELTSRIGAEEPHPNEVGEAMRQLSVDASVATGDVQRLGEVIDVLEASDSVGVPWRLPTGLVRLDSLLRGGWEPGRLYVTGARPKVGKTTALLNHTLEALTNDAVVLFASLELNDRELYSKLLSAQAWVPQSKVQDHLDRGTPLTGEEADQIAEAKAELRGADLFPLFSTDLPLGVESVAAAAAGLRTRFPDRPLMVVVDYIQLLIGSGGDRWTSVSQQVGQISRRLKLLAQELECAVVTPSQINRAGADTEDGMPKPHQLRESGNLEQDADCIIMLNRPHLQDESQPAHVMDLWVALSRVGASGRCQALYLPEYQTVTNLEEDEPGENGEPSATTRRDTGARQSRSDDAGGDDDYDA